MASVGNQLDLADLILRIQFNESLWPDWRFRIQSNVVEIKRVEFCGKFNYPQITNLTADSTKS